MPKIKVIYSNNVDINWDDIYTHIKDRSLQRKREQLEKLRRELGE